MLICRKGKYLRFIYENQKKDYLIQFENNNDLTVRKLKTFINEKEFQH